MKVIPGQPFSIGGSNLVLEQAEDGTLEIKELEPEPAATKTVFQDIGAEIDKKVRSAMEAIKGLSPGNPVQPLTGLG